MPAALGENGLGLLEKTRNSSDESSGSQSAGYNGSLLESDNHNLKDPYQTGHATDTEKGLFSHGARPALDVRSMMRSLKPSFLVQNPFIGGPPGRQSSTAYLDGVRGIASFIVFLHHYPLDYFHDLHIGYLSEPRFNNVLQMPFIRIITSGRFMVAMFFVLSGFVLSHKAFRLIHANEGEKLLDTLSSSVFRRWIRLYLPAIPATFYTMLCIHNGWYGCLDPIVSVPPILPFWQQVGAWMADIGMLMNPFSYEIEGSKYATQLWTLPVEFRGSMIVFVLLLGLARVQTWVRIGTIMGIAFYTLCTYHWEIFLFLGGMLLSEFSLLRQQISVERLSEMVMRRGIGTYTADKISKLFWGSVFVVSIYLGCWPTACAQTTPGYIGLAQATPSSFRIPGNGPADDEAILRFWTTLASILFMLSLHNLPILQKPFVTPIARYLGNVSFALYIVHIPICYTFGRMFTVAMMGSFLGRVAGFAVAFTVIGGIVMSVADVYWRLADNKSVDFARWLWVKSVKTE